MIAVLAQSQATLVGNLTMATTGGPPDLPWCTEGPLGQTIIAWYKSCYVLYGSPVSCQVYDRRA